MKDIQRKVLVISAFFLFVSGILLSAFPPDTKTKVAIVCFLEGKAWQLESGGKERKEIALFDWLSSGTEVETAPEAKVILALVTGDRYELGGKTKGTITKNGFVSQTGSAKKLSSVPIMPQIASISQELRPGSRMVGIRLRGAKKIISNLYPGENASSLADETALSFLPVEGIEKYRVVVEDEWGNIVLSVETSSPQVIVSPGILKPGQNYYWQVQTLDKNMPSAVSYEAFSTVKEEKSKILKALRTQTAQSKDGLSLLLLAQMELALGLRKEACSTLKEAQSYFPDNEEIKKVLSKAQCR